MWSKHRYWLDKSGRAQCWPTGARAHTLTSRGERVGCDSGVSSAWKSLKKNSARACPQRNARVHTHTHNHAHSACATIRRTLKVGHHGAHLGVAWQRRDVTALCLKMPPRKRCGDNIKSWGGGGVRTPVWNIPCAWSLYKWMQSFLDYYICTLMFLWFFYTFTIVTFRLHIKASVTFQAL